MTDPIEAVARAILATLDLPEDQFRRPVSDAMACAAIAAFLDAVREPSANAKDAGTEVLYGEDFVGNPKASTTAMETWRAMIDALRAELLPPPEAGA